MRNIKLEWKEFNVDLEAVEASIKVLIPNKCIGVSAGNELTIHVEDSTTDEEIESINSLWTDIEADSEEATSYRSDQQIKEAIAAMKAAVPSKTWAQMSAVERGLLIGLVPTKAQLIEAELL